MTDPYAAARKVLEDSVLRGPGKLASKLRLAVAGIEGEVAEDLKVLIEKMERTPYKVTDEDIAALKSKYTEDQIFEIVISAALGASRRRLEAGLRALEEAK